MHRESDGKPHEKAMTMSVGRSATVKGKQRMARQSRRRGAEVVQRETTVTPTLLLGGRSSPCAATRFMLLGLFDACKLPFTNGEGWIVGRWA